MNGLEHVVVVSVPCPPPLSHRTIGMGNMLERRGRTAGDLSKATYPNPLCAAILTRKTSSVCTLRLKLRLYLT